MITRPTARMLGGMALALGVLLWRPVQAPLLAQGPAPQSADQADTEETGHAAAAEQAEHAVDAAGADHGGSRISDEYIPLQLEDFPQRPKPLLELGSPFLGTGRIRRGLTLPSGAVWTPSFVAFGSYRSGLSVIDDGATQRVEWANRLDVFGNLALTGTERFVFGLRPTDQTDGDGVRRFSGYTSESPGDSGFNDEFNFGWDTVTHLFFEGELAELWPSLDVEDRRGLDFGFSVGRQPINFQEGLLINDFIDAVGVTQNNLRPGGTVNVRITGLYGWNQINRNTPSATAAIRNLEAESARLIGAFTEIDWRSTTAAFDVVYVRGGRFADAGGLGIDAGDGVYAGLSFVGRPGGRALNVAVRLLTSVAVGDTVPELDLRGLGNPASDGSLLFTEMSWTPHHTHDFFYLNGFWAIDEYRAAALDPTVPGPLARTGMLFAGPGLGGVPGAVSPTASDAVGGAIGHQRFSTSTRRQLLLELGGRYGTAACVDDTTVCDPHTLAAGARYQLAVARRGVLVFDIYAARDWLRGSLRDSLRGNDASPASDARRFRVGGRAELVIKF